jgi:hypothetical protein
MSLENVQPGDTLIVHSNGPRVLMKVVRVTKTQIVTANNKFRKSDGNLVGDTDWHSYSVDVPKPGEIEEIFAKQHQRKWVCKVEKACQINLLRKMSVEKLQHLKEILEMP